MRLSVYGITLFSLLGLAAYLIYLTPQRDLDNKTFGSEPPQGPAVQIQKTSLTHAVSHDWRVEDPKRLGRLQLSHYLELDIPKQNIRQQAAPQQGHPRRIQIEKKPEVMPLSISGQIIEPARALTSKYTLPNISDNFPRTHPRTHPRTTQSRSYAQALALPTFGDFQFTDHIEELAGASPIRPGSRDCGSLIQNISTQPKYDRVKSVGMSRQLTDRTSVGVEYVYKDGCYNNQIVASRSLNMPSDDGVNLRVNMRF